MKNYLPQRHRDEDKDCTSLLTSTLLYERQYMVSITQMPLIKMYIKIQQGMKETTSGNVSLLHFWRQVSHKVSSLNIVLCGKHKISVGDDYQAY